MDNMSPGGDMFEAAGTPPRGFNRAAAQAAGLSGTGCGGGSGKSAAGGAFDRRCCFASWRALRVASFCFFA